MHLRAVNVSALRGLGHFLPLASTPASRHTTEQGKLTLTLGSLPEEQRERAKKLHLTKRTETSQQRLVQDTRQKRTGWPPQRSNSAAASVPPKKRHWSENTLVAPVKGASSVYVRGRTVLSFTMFPAD